MPGMLLCKRVIGRMKRGFGCRQGENEPAVADIHERKFKNVAEEGAVRFWFLAVEKNVCAGDHGGEYNAGAACQHKATGINSSLTYFAGDFRINNWT